MLLQTFCHVPGQEPFDAIHVTVINEAAVSVAVHEMDGVLTVIKFEEESYTFTLTLNAANLGKLKAALNPPPAAN